MELSESGARALGWLTESLAGRPVPALVMAIGLGDGGLLEALAAVAPATRVLALEPDAAASFTVASGRGQDWSAAGRLVYLTAPDFVGADQAWRVFPVNPDDHHLFVHPESAVRARELAVRAARIAQQVLFGVRANAEARRQFAAPYLLNTLHNLPVIARSADVTALRDAYAGTPAVVVGAGPSLDAVVPALAGAVTRALVIATDTALRPLLHAGVTPALVAGLDPSAANARHFLALPEMRGSWLVAESALAPAAVSAFADRSFWFRAGAHHPWPFLSANGVAVSELPVWGSVLTAAYQVALLAGCDPIVFVGADLAFTGGRPYARGTTYEFDWAYSAALGADLAHVWQMQMAMRDCLPAVDVYGRETVTTAPLQSFRDWLVANAARSGRRVVNASGNGILHGAGIELGDLATAVGRGQPVRPIAELAKPPACAQPDALRRQLAAVRATVAGGQGSQVRAWAEFAGERYDAAALTRALDDALADAGRAGAAPGAFVPWAALPATLSSYAGLCQLPERMAAHQARLSGRASSRDGVAVGTAAPSGEDLRALTSLLVPLLSGLADYREDTEPPVARHDALGVPAVAGTRDWPSRLAWPMQIFESAAVTPARVNGAGTFLGAAVRLRDAATVPTPVTTGMSHDAVRAQTRLVVEWLAMVAACDDAAVSDPGVLARCQAIVSGAVDTDAGGPATSAECLVVLDVDLADTGVAVRFAVDERRLARVLTGALVPADDSAGQSRAARPRGCGATPAVTIRVGAWRAQCAVGPASDGRSQRGPSALWAAHHLAPIVLTETGMARSAFAYGSARGAVCVGMHAHESVVVRPDGTVAPHLSWPRPIIGELPLGESGAVAWNNGTADWPEVGEGYVLYRLTADGPVIEEALPFRPTNGAWWRGRLHWSTYPTGIGSWAPGEAPRQWLPDASFSGVWPNGDSLVLAACTLDAWGGYERRLVTAGWRLTPGDSIESVAFGHRGATTAMARHVHGWTATAHPQADCVALRHPTDTPFDLTCYEPIAVAWTGDSLVACTGEGDVLLFPDLAVRLSAT
jgi:Protein of unknown function DUF115